MSDRALFGNEPGRRWRCAKGLVHVEAKMSEFDQTCWTACDKPIGDMTRTKRGATCLECVVAP